MFSFNLETSIPSLKHPKEKMQNALHIITKKNDLAIIVHRFIEK